MTRTQVLAFRAAGHGLGQRRPASGGAGAVAVAGLRRTKQAALALAARVEGVGGDDVRGALAGGRLVAVYGPRCAVTLVVPDDVPVFTVGALPAGEASLRAALPGAFLARLDAAGMAATDALDVVVAALSDVLAGGPQPRGVVAQAVTRAVPPVLAPPCRGRCPDPHVEDSLFSLAGTAGTMCFDGDADVLAALGQPAMAAAPARAQLVRRYLGAYGPSTPAALAGWAGISPADARGSLRALDDEAVEVSVDGTRAGVLLADDVEAATSAQVRGHRFLPPFDPYLLDRDRATLVPDRAAQKVVWRAVGNPGVVLADGEPVATWRTATSPARLALTVAHLPGRPAPDLDALQEEAARVGVVLGRPAVTELAG